MSRPQREWGREAHWMSLILMYLGFSPLWVFFEMGNWEKSRHPAYGEKPPDLSRPTGASSGGGGMARGLDPESGFRASIQDSRSSIARGTGPSSASTWGLSWENQWCGILPEKVERSNAGGTKG